MSRPQSYHATTRPAAYSIIQLLQQINHFHGLGHRQLSEIGATAVSTFGVLEVNQLMPLLQHARRHLARVTGMDAVILGVSPEENLWIVSVSSHILIGGVFRDEIIMRWNIGIAVFRSPTGTS